MSVTLDAKHVAPGVRLVGLALVVWSVVHGSPAPGTSGRGLLVTILLGVATLAWLRWTWSVASDRRPLHQQGVSVELYVMAVAGGLLCGLTPDTAASAFVFVAIVSAALRTDLGHTGPVVGLATLGLGLAVLLYDGGALGALAYALGFVGASFGAATARQSGLRADQAELLLAQTQRSHEEQVRSARLEESTRIARDIHDVVAHTLAGLTIQLEATRALVQQGADRDIVLERVGHAYDLAREGLAETRQAVGVLRNERTASIPEAVGLLVADYRSDTGAPADLDIDGDRRRLAGDVGQAVLRVVQEALTNVRKHAPGAEVAVVVDAGADPGDEIVIVVEDGGSAVRGGRDAGAALGEAGQGGDGPPPAPSVAEELALSGGGYGLRGMRERAELLGGTLAAGAAGCGWRVELRLPPRVPAAPAAVNPAVRAR